MFLLNLSNTLSSVSDDEDFLSLIKLTDTHIELSF